MSSPSDSISTPQPSQSPSLGQLVVDCTKTFVVALAHGTRLSTQGDSETTGTVWGSISNAFSTGDTKSGTHEPWSRNQDGKVTARDGGDTKSSRWRLTYAIDGKRPKRLKMNRVLLKNNGQKEDAQQSDSTYTTATKFDTRLRAMASEKWNSCAGQGGWETLQGHMTSRCGTLAADKDFRSVRWNVHSSSSTKAPQFEIELEVEHT